MSSPKTWTVVTFEADNTVQAVPTKWIHGDNNCLWPVLPQDKLMRSLRNCDYNTHWPSHKIKIFRNATYDDYAIARSKAAKAEYCSDLTSEEDQPRPRKKQIISSSDSDDEAKRNQNKKKNYKVEPLPKPPRPPPNWSESFVGDTNNAEMVEIPVLDVDKKATPVLAEYKKMNKHSTPKVPVGNVETSVSVENYSVNMDDITPKRHVVKGKENKIGCTVCHCKSLLLNVQSLLTDLHAKVDRLNSSPIVTEESGGGSILLQSQIDFPIQSEENLIKFEEFLNSQHNFKSLVSLWSRMGGVNVYDFIKRCLREILSDELATQFSFIGRKGKKKFNILLITKALIESAEKAGISKTTKETELAIGGWLRKAKDRSKKQ